MSTTITRIQFGASMWMPRPDPPRAVMPIVVTVAGFDTSDLIVDLATWLSAHLAWGELYQTIIPLDSVPIEAVDIEVVAARVGALLVAVSPNQRAPEYPEEGYGAEPDSADCLISLEQFVSSRSEDRDLLVERRRDLVKALAPVSGTIG